jgi:DNA adenine methylase
MQYLGGKSRIAGQLSEAILASTASRLTYVEPFLGAGSMAAMMVPHFVTSYLADASPDLIALWANLQDGWLPPESVSEQTYQELRNAPVSALRGFAGYGCSFGGKWFGGYARDPKQGRNFARTAGNLLLKRIKLIGSASFTCLDYRNMVVPDGSVVYLDPPYRAATKYARLDDFDSDEFWSVAEKWARHSSVFVSEYSAPDNWQSIWQSNPRVTMRVDSNSPRPTEHLWRFNNG